MPIAIACRFCDWKGKVKDELAGKNGKCPTCGELVPIPNTPSKSPPPLAGKKSAVPDDEPDIVDDADFVEEEDDRPKPKPRPSAGRSVGGALDSVGRGRRDDDEEDERPRSRRSRDEDEDDEPRARSRKRRDDEEDERPSKSRRRAVDDDDDEPRSRSRKRRDDDEDRPRRPKRRKRRETQSRNTKRVGAVVGGVICLILGLGLLAFQAFVLERGIRIYTFIVIALAIIGILQGLTGIGLGGSDDDSGD